MVMQIGIVWLLGFLMKLWSHFKLFFHFKYYHTFFCLDLPWKWLQQFEYWLEVQIYLAGKTYRIRVHNVGISTTLNFRIQNHNLLLVETEGHYTIQTNFSDFDIHAGQSYSFLLSTDQNASTDYYIVASARFVNESLWQRVTGVAILHYTNSKGKASGPLPPPPDDFYNKGYSMNQAKSVRFVTENLIS